MTFIRKRRINPLLKVIHYIFKLHFSHFIELNAHLNFLRHDPDRITGKFIQTIFKSFFNFFNLFKLRQKKRLFLEEKQVNDETKKWKRKLTG